MPDLPHPLVPPSPPSGLPAPAGDVDGEAAALLEVPWRGRDLLIGFLAGTGMSMVLGAAVFVPLVILGARPSAAAQLALVSLIFYTSYSLFGWYFALGRHRARLADAGFRWVGSGPLLLMIPVVIAMIMANGAILFVIDRLIGGVPSAQDQVLPGATSLSVPDLTWLLLAGVVGAPFVEEFVFRGLLYRYLRARRGIASATAISAALFALMHFSPILIPSYLVFGIVTAVVAERYKSLYPAIALHAFNNGALLVAMYFVLNA